MSHRRATITTCLLAAACVLLGAILSIGIALLFAWLRDPVRTFGSNVVAVAPLTSPKTMGKYTIVEMWWNLQLQRRVGERTLSWMSDPAPEHYNEPFAQRPFVPAPIQEFFDHKYLPESAHWSLDRYSINVARAYGWPFCCLWQGETVDGMNAGLTTWPWNGFSCGGLKIGMSGPLPKYLPALPLWPGLLTDTALYALLCFALIRGTPALRRTLRRRRNLCPACAYDRKGLPTTTPCPECGQTSSSR